MGEDYILYLVVFAGFCFSLFFFYEAIIKPVIDFFDVDTSFNGSVLRVCEFKGIQGQWLFLGKNSVKSDIFLRKDNLIKNDKYKIFERIVSITDPRFLNKERDKSSIITRIVDEETGQFKDYKFVAYSKTLCRGKKSGPFEEKKEIIPWSYPIVGTLDEYLSNVIKENENEITKIEVPEVIFS